MAEVALRNALQQAQSLRSALAEGDRSMLRNSLRGLDDELLRARETLWRLERTGAMSWDDLRNGATEAVRRLEHYLESITGNHTCGSTDAGGKRASSH